VFDISEDFDPISRPTPQSILPLGSSRVIVNGPAQSNVSEAGGEFDRRRVIVSIVDAQRDITVAKQMVHVIRKPGLMPEFERLPEFREAARTGTLPVSTCRT
jgi:hypothetical protein